MTWFSTNEFLFELPGDGWVEETIHVFYAKEDDRTGFVITRVSPVKGGDNSLEASIAALPKGLYDEKEIVRSEYRYFGAVDGQDVSFFARKGMDGSYFRIVSVPCHGRELSLQWMGPAGTREQVDERAERTLESLKFWSRQ